MQISTNAQSVQFHLDQIAEALNIKVPVAVKRMAFVAYRSITVKTPVKTGWARASWNLQDGFINGELPPKSNDEANAGTFARGANQFQISRAASVQDAIVWNISSAVPYIGLLEAGRTIQVDKGQMLARTLVEVATEADAIAAKVFKT